MGADPAAARAAGADAAPECGAVLALSIRSDGTVNLRTGCRSGRCRSGSRTRANCSSAWVVAPALGWWFEAARGGGAQGGRGALGEGAAPLRGSDDAARGGDARDGLSVRRGDPRRQQPAEWDHLYRTARSAPTAGLGVARSLHGRLRVVRRLPGAAPERLGPRRGGAHNDGGRRRRDLYTGRALRPTPARVVATNGAIHGEPVAELDRSAGRRADGGRLTKRIAAIVVTLLAAVSSTGAQPKRPAKAPAKAPASAAPIDPYADPTPAKAGAEGGPAQGGAEGGQGQGGAEGGSAARSVRGSGPAKGPGPAPAKGPGPTPGPAPAAGPILGPAAGPGACGGPGARGGPSAFRPRCRCRRSRRASGPLT